LVQIVYSKQKQPYKVNRKDSKELRLAARTAELRLTARIGKQRVAGRKIR
jgi:hypothetical protein